MSLSVILDPEAKTEYVEGYDYFESRRTGLGDEFAEAVEFVLDRISANPKLFRIVLSNFRCGVVQGFPYCVYYRGGTIAHPCAFDFSHQPKSQDLAVAYLIRGFKK